MSDSLVAEESSYLKKERERFPERDEPDKSSSKRLGIRVSDLAKSAPVVAGGIPLGVLYVASLVHPIPPIGHAVRKGIVTPAFNKLVKIGDKMEERTQEMLSYAYKMPDGLWEGPFEEPFIQDLISSYPAESVVPACNSCRHLLHSHSWTRAKLKAPWLAGCLVCQYICTAPKKHMLEDEKSVTFKCIPSKISDDVDTSIEPTNILNGECSFNIELLRMWITQTNKPHMFEQSTIDALPTRLLDLSHGDMLQLILSSEIDLETDHRYATLSYCWGDDKERTYCTYNSNLKERLESGFRTKGLPQTCLDAVKVAKALGLKYLWIDAFCIVQDDGSETREFDKMKDVYGRSYCTIAATSASNVKEGFLKDRGKNYILSKDKKERRVYLITQYGKEGSCAFEQDVDGAPINRRGWVLQERYLSPRTVHFDTRQMYFQCGDGIHLEDLTYWKCQDGSKKYFELTFPEGLKDYSFAHLVAFIQSFTETYSQCKVTNPRDRRNALKGLLGKIEAHNLGTQRFGIFDVYLHRSLLWQRPRSRYLSKIDYGSDPVPSWSWMAYNEEVDKVTPNDGISFLELSHKKKDKEEVDEKTPNDGISFLKLPHKKRENEEIDEKATQDKLSSTKPELSNKKKDKKRDREEVYYGALDINRDLRFAEDDKQALITTIWLFPRVSLAPGTQTGAPRFLKNKKDEKLGWVRYDTEEGENLDLEHQQLAVLARLGRSWPYKFAALVIKKSNKGERVYERLGVGIVKDYGSYIGHARII